MMRAFAACNPDTNVRNSRLGPETSEQKQHRFPPAAKKSKRGWQKRMEEQRKSIPRKTPASKQAKRRGPMISSTRTSGE